jgi:hypothetical protein
MFSGKRAILLLGGLILSSLGVAGMAPRASAQTAAATVKPVVLSAAAKALVGKLKQRYPHAIVQVNRMGGRTQTYAIYVNLAGQPGASLSTGAGAQALAWYLQAYPKQAVYALYSYEQDKDGLGFWEYEFVPAVKALRRYRFSFTANKTYPWTSWQLSTADVQHAATVGAWPKGVTHMPQRPAPTPPTSKKK